MMQAVKDAPIAPGGLSLAETLVSRICHDLAGHVFALAGSLELAGEEGALSGEAMSAATDAAASLHHRLELLRAAWGRSTEGLTMAGLRGLCRGLPLGKRTSVSLAGLHEDRAFTPESGQFMLNLLILGVESLHGAGTLAVTGAARGDVFLTLSGPRAAWPVGFALMLADPMEAQRAAERAGPREILPCFAALLAHRCGLSVSLLLAAESEAAAPLRIALDERRKTRIINDL